jgi:carbon-monoxide dehydrogenase large subunit
MNATDMFKPGGLERRREDYTLITGRSHYVDDLRSPQGRPAVLHMMVVRSPYAHAEIKHIELEEARALPGVVAAFTGEELVSGMRSLDSVVLPGMKRPERRPLAVGRARYVGDPVAIVLAEDRYTAADARDLVDVDYEPLPAISDPEAAVAPSAPLIYDEFGTNIAFRAPLNGGDIRAAFAQADHTLRLRLVNQRLASSSMEPRACMFDFDPASGQFSAWVSSQAIYRVPGVLAAFLGLDPAHIRVYNAEVGGGFGAKTTFVGEEIIAAALALKYGRPVKWIEDRSENLQAQTHGRGEINYVEAAFSNDGRLLGLKLRSLADLGAFVLGVGAVIPARMPQLVSGPYSLPAVESEMVGVFTNKVPTTPYRGAGRPEATYVLERTLDRIARELHLDPTEVRRRNLIAPDAFPYTTVTGVQYDSGDYQAGLERALELADYARWRAKQQERRQQQSTRLLGIGLSTFNEISGDGPPQPNAPRDSATVRIQRDGSILVMSGVSHTGQGHFTAFAQIAATVFHLPASQVQVRMNDSALPAFSIGTFGSRITQTGGSAVLLAAEAAREKALQVAARVLEAAPADLELTDGRVMVRGVPARMIELGELARMVEEQPDLIEHERPVPGNGQPIEGLAAWRAFAPSSAAYSSGAHVAVVEVDTETGEVKILSYVAVDDCGRVLNHYLLEAQLHGSLAQGIGQALYEEIVYDEGGQLLTSSLMDYALPIAGQVPDFITDVIETPSPTNPLGAKGVGESGCIGAPPTIVNAVLDALAPLGITSIDMPLRPEKIWALVQAARQGTLEQPAVAPPPIFNIA